jgi:hypothetical protein
MHLDMVRRRSSEQGIRHEILTGLVSDKDGEAQISTAMRAPSGVSAPLMRRWHG